VDEQEITDYLVKHLGDFDDPDDLILEICQKTGRPWVEVEALVDQVRLEHQTEITTHQFPLLALIALGTFIGGLALMALSVDLIIVTLRNNLDTLSKVPDFDTAVVKSFSDGIKPLVEFASGFLRTVYYAGISPFFFLALGISMVLGSLVGMRDTWAVILAPKGSHRKEQP
jgi:hypothetical protein